MRKTTIAVSKIKKFEDECTKFFEESEKVWEELMGNLEMKVVEEKLQEAQEHSNEVVEKATTLLPVEQMVAILAQQEVHVEVERFRDLLAR
jgi:hypothetical protein